MRRLGCSLLLTALGCTSSVGSEPDCDPSEPICPFERQVAVCYDEGELVRDEEGRPISAFCRVDGTIGCGSVVVDGEVIRRYDNVVCEPVCDVAPETPGCT